MKISVSNYQELRKVFIEKKIAQKKTMAVQEAVRGVFKFIAEIKLNNWWENLFLITHISIKW